MPVTSFAVPICSHTRSPAAINAMPRTWMARRTVSSLTGPRSSRHSRDDRRRRPDSRSGWPAGAGSPPARWWHSRAGRPARRRHRQLLRAGAAGSPPGRHAAPDTDQPQRPGKGQIVARSLGSTFGGATRRPGSYWGDTRTHLCKQLKGLGVDLTGLPEGPFHGGGCRCDARYRFRADPAHQKWRSHRCPSCSNAHAQPGGHQSQWCRSSSNRVLSASKCWAHSPATPCWSWWAASTAGTATSITSATSMPNQSW
jgi:hypothetical protein